MLTWLLVGLGDIATKRAGPAILAEPRSKLAGVVTRDPAKAGPYGVPAWPDLDQALSGCDAEAVYVATPPALHAQHTIASLLAGRHVLCEKPTALSYAEAYSMQRVADESGRRLGVAYYRRSYPKVHRARKLLEAGVIGRPFLAEATAHEWRSEEGLRNSWRVQPEMAGGGPLYDVASHRIDLMNFLFGIPVRATGHFSTLVLDIRVEDNATVLVDYETGVRAVVDVRWHSRVSRDEFRIRGADGEMDLSPYNGPDLVFPGGHEHIPAPDNFHYPCIENFVSAILDGEPMHSPGSSAILTDWVTEQVVKAASI